MKGRLGKERRNDGCIESGVDSEHSFPMSMILIAQHVMKRTLVKRACYEKQILF